MKYSYREKSIINIVDRIEGIKEQIMRTEDHDERETLRERLNQLYIMRSYYIQLITRDEPALKMLKPRSRR
ncbi:hypothetical protein [Syntrophomonas curvata]